MEIEKLLSIIITTYNSEKTIKSCVESLYQQIDRRVEIILIDDGSTDETVNIVRKNFSDVKVYCQKNSGVGIARNKGISIASGKYVWFIDSDDSVPRNVIGQKFMKLFNLNYDLIIFGFFKKKNGKTIKVVNDKRYSFENNWHQNFENVFLNNALNPLWNKIYKREIIRKNNLKFNSFRSGEDAYFNYKLFLFTHKVLVVNKAIYNYNLFTESSYKKVWNRELHEDNLVRITNLYNLLHEFGINKSYVGRNEVIDTLLGEEINIFKKYGRSINFQIYKREMEKISDDYKIPFNIPKLNKSFLKEKIVCSDLLSYLFIKLSGGI